MTTITPVIRQAIEQAGDSHPEMFDPSTNKTYFLVTSKWLQSIRDRLKSWDDGEDYDEYRNLLPATGQGDPHSNPRHKSEASVTTIPTELLQVIAEAGEHPVRLVHPETDRVYLLVPDPRKENETKVEDISSMEYLIDELDPEDWVDASRYGL